MLQGRVRLNTAIGCYIELLDRVINFGKVGMFFLWLPNAEMAVSRAENRVKEGGHRVPREAIRRRYQAGVRNLFGSTVQSSIAGGCTDASRLPPKLIATEGDGLLVVKRKGLYSQIEEQTEERSMKNATERPTDQAGGCRFSPGRPKGSSNAQKEAGTPLDHRTMNKSKESNHENNERDAKGET